MIQSLNFQVPYLFRNWKSRSFQGCQDQPNLTTFEGGDPCLEKSFRAIKSPKHPLDQNNNNYNNKKETSRVLCFAWTIFELLSSLPNSKNTSKPLDSSFFIKNTKYCSYTQPSSPWFYTFDLGFMGVDVPF